MNLEEKLKLLPDESGAYMHKGKNGEILYVGKAKNLKNRIRSYFQNTGQTDPRLVELILKIKDVDWIVTNTEAEALILEDHLIKTHKPKYNVRLRDDKTYPCLKLSVHELFPRLTLTREIKNDGSLYFGPYVNVFAVRFTLKIIRKYFPLRQKNLPLDGTKTYRPCLNYQLNRCYAPCAGKISSEEYAKLVDKIQDLLKGNYRELITKLKSEMSEKSKNLEFEEAARIRDRIEAVETTLQKQRVVSAKKVDRDVFAIVRQDSLAGIQVLFIRNGNLLSGDFFFIKNGGDYDDRELLRSTLSRLYVSGGAFIPNELVLPIEYEDSSMLEEYLSSRRNRKIKLSIGTRGEKKSQVEMAGKNGKENLKIKTEATRTVEEVLSEVATVLRLKELPFRVECFDISNTSGVDSVASMAVWENNQASKKDYKRYKIKSVEGPNDFASMEEVLQRRYKRALSGEMPLPNLIVIDGGKGQLSSAIKIFEDLRIDLDKVDLIGLAKGRSQRRAKVQKMEDYEYVVKPNQKNEILLKKNSTTLFFLQNIRDEAHRFAITYHRKLRGKKIVSSKLDRIAGIGPKKKKILLKNLGGLPKIEQAGLEELQNIQGISQKDAQNIFEFFHSNNGAGSSGPSFT